MLFSNRNYLLLIQKKEADIKWYLLRFDQDLPALGPWNRQDWLQKYVKLSSPEAIETWMSLFTWGCWKGGGWQTWFLVCVCFLDKKNLFFGGIKWVIVAESPQKKLAPPKKVEYRVGWLFLAKLKTVLPVVDTLNDLRYFWGGRWLQNDVRKLPVLVAENLPWRCIRNRIRNNDSLQISISPQEVFLLS